MTRYAKILASIPDTTVVAQNADWLGTDFAVNRAGAKLVVCVQTSTAVAVSLSPNTGFALTLGTTTAGTLMRYELYVDAGRTWNVQTGTVGGTTVRFLSIAEVDA